MTLIRKVFSLAICFHVAAALAGCAAQNLSATPNLYFPVSPPGKTLASAVNDLANTMTHGKWVWVEVASQPPAAAGNIVLMPVKCTFNNNQIDLLQQNGNQMITRFGFHSLLGQNIVVETPAGKNHSFIALPGLVKLRFAKLDEAKKVADAFYTIQMEVKGYRDRLEKQLAEFEPVAAKYRSLAEKPRMSEEQRKLIVQANALTEQKEYFKARDKYRQALALGPTAYPAAYYNLALLDAQMNLPFAAILYMKHYLLLGPAPKDARSGQDKIYEWELLMPAAQNTAAASPHARGYLGIRYKSPTDGSNPAAPPDSEGVLVIEVIEGSPAQQGGIQVGDIIRTLDGKPVGQGVDLPAFIAATQVGTTVEFGIRRGDQDQTLNITIAKTPD